MLAAAAHLVYSFSLCIRRTDEDSRMSYEINVKQIGQRWQNGGCSTFLHVAIASCYNFTDF